LGDSPCLVRVINQVISSKKEGYPELGIPPFDPLKVEKMDIVSAGDGPVSLKLYLKNIEIFGLSGIEFSSIEGFNHIEETGKIDMKFNIPFMQILGPYKVEGRMLVLPVQGDGIANMTLLGLDTQLKMLVRKYEQKGKVYLKIEKTKLNFEPQG